MANIFSFSHSREVTVAPAYRLITMGSKAIWFKIAKIYHVSYFSKHKLPLIWTIENQSR